MVARKAQRRKRKPYRRRKTAARGLGGAHQNTRKDQVKALAARPGLACPKVSICGGAPMFATELEAARAGLPRKLWAVDLDDYPGRVFGGPQVKRLMHRHCNRSAGATMGNRMRALQRATGYTRW